MRVPERLEPLMDQGVIDEVVRPLMSGKEAQVFLVMSDGQQRVAKVYKEATQRSFKNRADYTEGRRVRNTREQRAMEKRSRYGKAQVEEAWRSAEVDAIYKLRNAGVRVPEPFDFLDGVLIMELVADANGEPAPRLADLNFTPEEARPIFKHLLIEVQKMLCAGVVHGDLSDFNVLFGPEGPVIIDFPQAVDPAFNNNARKLLIRDVDNLTSFLARHDPELKGRPYGQEMWELHERGQLTPQTRLTGRWKAPKGETNVSSLLAEIEELEAEALKRRESLGLSVRPARKPIAYAEEAPAPRPLPERGGRGRAEGRGRGDEPRGRSDDGRAREDRSSGERGDRRRDEPTGAPPPARGPSRPEPVRLDPSGADGGPDGASRSKRRRRRKKKGGDGGGGGAGDGGVDVDDLDAFLVLDD